MRRTLLVLVALCAAAGCKKSKRDQSSPESTVASLFSAINTGELEGQYEVLFADPRIRKTWQMTCKVQGCKKGTFKVVEVKERTDNTATLLVDYEIKGKNNLTVYKGKTSPFTLERLGSRWSIVSVGTHKIGHKPAPAAKTPATATTADAGLAH
jgi:hypothetical protein